jgi:hypothetical protein
METDRSHARGNQAMLPNMSRFLAALSLIIVSSCGATATDGQTVCGSLRAVAAAAQAAAAMCDQWVADGNAAETCPTTGEAP